MGTYDTAVLTKNEPLARGVRESIVGLGLGGLEENSSTS